MARDSLRSASEADQGLIKESGERAPSDANDTRRRYYRLCSYGRKVLSAEIERLDEFIRAARAKRRSLNAEATS